MRMEAPYLCAKSDRGGANAVGMIMEQLALICFVWRMGVTASVER